MEETREWRQHVRYCFVPKAPMTGTPREFIYDLVSSGLPDLESAVSVLLAEWEMEETLLDREWKQLSTGEMQRVWLSIGFASSPSVLLLDEPTSALDEESKMQVEATL